MKTIPNKMKRCLISIILIISVIFLLSSCDEVPKDEDFSVSDLVDLKIINYRATQYEFHNVSDFLKKDDLEGNMITINYSGKNGTDVKIVSAHTTKSKAVYHLWRNFAKENNVLFKSSFTSIPFVMGEFKAENDNLYCESWFKEKWFFYIESDRSEEVEAIRIRLIDFFENPVVINERVIDL